MRRDSRFQRSARLFGLSFAAFATLNLKRLAGVAAVAIAILLIVLLFRPSVETVFNVVAHTEYVEGVVAPPTSRVLTMSWKFDDAELCRGVAPNASCQTFKGKIFLSDGVQFRARRISGGSLRVDLVGRPDRVDIQQATGGTLPFESPTTIVVADPEEHARKGKSLVLPFIARSLTVGREPSLQTPTEQPLLRSAQISMLSRSLIGGRPFFAGEIALDEGDQFSIASGIPQAGVITADERPLLNVIYRAQAKQGRARRFFVFDDIMISASPFERLQNDPALAGLASILMALIAIYGVIKVD